MSTTQRVRAMCELKRYRISLNAQAKAALWRTGSSVPDTEIHAFSRASAWGKFVTQYFGALKPNRKDYHINEVQS